jgi:N-acyl-D-amino-acid deacylase
VDYVIRDGLVVDGSGGDPFYADVAVKGDRIVEIGKDLSLSGAENVDAQGCIVTPGFVDVHTHYDGQAIWSERLAPSSEHGVTTVALGNCGVGFAPCRAVDRELLVSVMEGVEDIPEIVMTEGLSWNWETFPDYLDALDMGHRDIDVAAYIPHSALRVFVMGERGANREPATSDDLVQMASLVFEALRAGAIGFATANVSVHRTSSGDPTPTFGAAEDELMAIAGAMRKAGRGVFQILVDLSVGSLDGHIRLLSRLSLASGRVVTFTLMQLNNRPTAWREVLDLVDQANCQPGVTLCAQVLPRPIGVLLSHDLTLNPFKLCPSYAPLEGLSLKRKIAELRRPELRAKLLREAPIDPRQPSFVMARLWERMFKLEDSPNYEPAPDTSIASIARKSGRTPEEVAYDMLVDQDGRNFILSAVANYSEGTLDPTYHMLRHPACIPGLGDGGAHYGLICDASFPTHFITHWTRDRNGEKLSVANVIASLSRRSALMMGLHDRGLLAAGYKADINVIDYSRLKVHVPHVSYDLPSGGRRVLQRATGYVATFVSGELIVRNDECQPNLPGKLARLNGDNFGSQPLAS